MSSPYCTEATKDCIVSILQFGLVEVFTSLLDSHSAGKPPGCGPSSVLLGDREQMAAFGIGRLAAEQLGLGRKPAVLNIR